MTAIAVYKFLLNHKSQAKKLRTGNWRSLEVDLTPSQLLTGNFKFQAYQSAYLAWGFCLQLFSLWIIMVLLSWLVILITV